MTDAEIAIGTILMALVAGSLIISGLPDGAWKAIIVALCIMSAGCGLALLYIFLSIFGYLS